MFHCFEEKTLRQREGMEENRASDAGKMKSEHVYIFIADPALKTGKTRPGFLHTAFLFMLPL